MAIVRVVFKWVVRTKGEGNGARVSPGLVRRFGGEATIKITVKTPASAMTISNTAEVASQADLVSGNNRVTVDTTVR